LHYPSIASLDRASADATQDREPGIGSEDCQDDVRVVIGGTQAHVVRRVAAAGVVVVDVLGQDRARMPLTGDTGENSPLRIRPDRVLPGLP
jgi:hypothetical protein